MTQTNPRKNSKFNFWLIAIVVAVVGYGLLQPVLNSQLGLQLPSVADLAGEGAGEGAAEGAAEGADEARPKKQREADSTASTAPTNSQAKPEQVAGVETQAVGVDPLTEYLRETPAGSENYVSPEGLRYTRGSEEGHRLKHLERHLADQPNRPGKHGVFAGDLLQVLRWLDDAYVRGESGARGTKRKDEGGRTVFEVPFEEAIGFVGGQVGRREGKPPAKKIRLVVEDDRVITAFPF